MANDDLQGHLILHLEGLDQRREIGRGAFGTVYEVKLNGLPCIAKGLHQILLGMGGYERVGKKDVDTMRAKFLQECSLLSKLKHPNIVQFLGIHHTKEKDVLLLMESMHMDLAKCLETHPDIPLPLKLSILLDVSYGLQHLHSQTPPIIHHDLTAANVLLTEGLRAKIAYLGVSKIFDLQQIQRATHTAAPGAQAYMPPEALSPKPQYDTKLDSFSFGVLSLYTANQEFPSVHELPMTTAILQKGEVQIFKRKHWIDKMGENHTLYPLVRKCLQDRPDQRPSAKELSDVLSGLCTQHPKKCETILEDTILFTPQQEIASLKEQVEMGKLQLAACQECFANERIERTKAAENTDKYKKDVKMLVNNLIECKVKLEEAKEEIAVKESQMKQYQKELEVYKQQDYETLNIEVEKVELAKHKKVEGQSKENLSGGIRIPPPVPHKSSAACDLGVLPSSCTQNSGQQAFTQLLPSVQDRGWNRSESQVTIPRQIPNSSQANIPSRTPILSQSVDLHQQLISDHHSDQLIVDTPFNVGSVKPGFSVSPHLHNSQSCFPQKGVKKHCNEPELVNTQGIVSTLNTYPPLDTNLKCIFCGWTFRKEEIQIFKKHMLECLHVQ